MRPGMPPARTPPTGSKACRASHSQTATASCWPRARRAHPLRMQAARAHALIVCIRALGGGGVKGAHVVAQPATVSCRPRPSSRPWPRLLRAPATRHAALEPHGASGHRNAGGAPYTASHERVCTHGDQAGRLSQGKNVVIVTTYDRHQLVQLNHTPLVVTLVASKSANTGVSRATRAGRGGAAPPRLVLTRPPPPL